MSIISIVHLFAFIADVALIIIVISRNPKAQLNRLCALVTASFAVWSLGYCLTHTANTADIAMFWINISSIGWITFPVAGLYFYFALAGKEKNIRNKAGWVVSIILIAFFFYEQWAGNLVGSVIEKPYGWSGVWTTSVYSYLLYAFFISAALYFIYLIYDYGRKVKTNRERVQARLLQATAMVGFSLGLTTDIILPALNVTILPQLADIFVSIWGLGIVIGVTRYGLMSVSPITAAEQILDTMTDSLILLEPNGSVKQSNRATLELLEYSENELKGTGFDTLTTAKKSADDFLKETIHAGKSINKELTFKTKTGNKIPVLISASVIQDRTKTIAGFVVLARDITEHKRLEENIRYHASLVDSISDAIVSSDNDYTVISWNKGAEKMYGWREEEVLGKNVLDILKPVYTNVKLEDIRASMDKTGYWQGEAVQQRKDGTKLHTLDSLSMRRDAQGNNIGAVSVFRDITENKNIEKAFIESEERFSKAFYASPDAISISRAGDGIFLEVNDSYVKASGYTRAEIIGKSADLLNMWHDVEQRDRIARAIKEHVRMQNEEFQFRTKSGELRTKLISNEFIHLGGEFCVLVVSVDITESKKIEEALRKSEEKFSVAFYSSPSAMCIVTIEEEKFVEVNESFIRFTGYTREEIIGRNSSELNFWLSDNEMKRMATGLQEKGRIYNEEYLSRNKSGEIRIGLFSAETITITGKACLIMVITDITERRQTQQALQASEENIRLQKELIERVLATIPNAVFLLGTDLKVIMTNQAAYNIFKLNAQKAGSDLVGRPLEIDELNHTITNMISSKENSAHIEFRRVIAEHEKLLNADVFTMPKDELLVVVNDITEEREKQERLYLTDRLASVGEMASGVAHELNNPLTSIIGLSSLILEQPAPGNIDDIKEDLNAINSEAKRCAAVVKNLLTFARQHAPTRQPVNVAKIMEDVIKLRAYEHKANNISVQVKFPNTLPEVLADYFQMQQVFLNIILNAEAAMIEAHGHGTLKITGESINKYIRISFADDGPGIPKENIRLIFNPFFTTKDVGKGTGLGLSICYGIVTAHEGKIYAKSERGQGATFVVELPVNGHTAR
ncbi:MAG: PAS domain S-box protein [Dehalococcoidales bacterium]